jgi:hypothetical protein
MPEGLLCSQCQGPIDPERENYVVTNKAQAPEKEHWLYAHNKCQAEHAERHREIVRLEHEAQVLDYQIKIASLKHQLQRVSTAPTKKRRQAPPPKRKR